MASNGSAKLSRDMGMFRGSSSKEFQRSNVSLSVKELLLRLVTLNSLIKGKKVGTIGTNHQNI